MIKNLEELYQKERDNYNELAKTYLSRNTKNDQELARIALFKIAM